MKYPERGYFMGNRGILHDEQGHLTNRRWTTHAWIICLLDFKGRKRQVMSPGTYTELFFLDEATALSAGHRPCGECRHTDYQHFKSCWMAGNKVMDIHIKEIDRQLHSERVNRNHEKLTYSAPIDSLPDGTFIGLDSAAYLVWQDALWRWSPAGYVAREFKPRNLTVTVLTPGSTVNALRAGYVPHVHEAVP